MHGLVIVSLADRYGKLMNDIDAELKANDDRFTPKIDKMIDECIALIDEQDKARLALSL